MHLVIQGPDVSTPDLKQLAKLSGASRIERIADSAFRLHDAHAADPIADLCEQSGIDYAFVPAERRLQDFRLLVMDMDSTLITIETIDELADLVGLKPQVADITARAMRGEIEYNESLQHRVALLSGLEETALDRVYEERLRLSSGAEELLHGVKRVGIKTLLVSGGFTRITEKLKTRLHLCQHAGSSSRQADRQSAGAHRERRRQARGADPCAGRARNRSLANHRHR
jgi:phosphoserine phosphatase